LGEEYPWKIEYNNGSEVCRNSGGCILSATLRNKNAQYARSGIIDYFGEQNTIQKLQSQNAHRD